MWHEARRQERKIRGMLVDYRRRAERRRDFYEKIKADPTQFLQIHGRQCKIHLDQNIAAAADTAVMMPWQGHPDNLIDRFDVRAHLDFIPPVERDEEDKLTQDERNLNYERYRIIAQNSFLGIPEEKFLKQLHLEEQFGFTEVKTKKDSRSGGAAIGFNYEDSTGFPQENVEESEEDNSDSDLDVDLAINVSKMDPTQANEMNKHGRNYGMSSNDFYSFLINDLEEAEAVRLAREEEQEKALFSGRKSRRERRYHREKRLANRTISPPSYAAKASPTLINFRESKSKSHSRSPSPENTGKITYITSFGEDEETPSSSKLSFASKVKFGKSKPKTSSEKVSSSSRRRSRSKSRSRDNYYSKINRSRNSINNTSRSRRSRTRSRSRSRRSRSRSGYRKHRSRSSTSRSKSYSRSRSRSRNSRNRSNERSKPFRRRRSTSSSSSCSNSSSRSSSSNSSIHKPLNKTSSEKNKIGHPAAQEMASDVIPRYYGRRKTDHSSSDLSDLNDDEKPNDDPAGGDAHSKDSNNSLATAKKPSSSSAIIERLKRKRQALLNRQFKADKIAEQIKTERERLEQQTREDELREMAIKLRKRQREKRHANDSVSSSDSDDSKSDDSVVSKNRSRSRSREKKLDDSRRHDYRRDRRPHRRSEDRRSNSRERRRRDRRDRDDRDRDDRNKDDRDRRVRRSRSPRRGSKERNRDEREKSKNTRLVNY